MKKITIKISILLILFVLSCLFYKQDKEEFFVEEIEVEEMVYCDDQEILLDDYLLGVVAGEMPASFELEALKAQVVASRTYVYSREMQVDATTLSQVYLDSQDQQVKWGDNYELYVTKIQQAIEETKGVVLMYEGDYISALFFSYSNGYTENNEDYFNGEAVSYLRSVESPYDSSVRDLETTVSFSKDELVSIFNVSEIVFSEISYYDSGRFASICVSGELYTGREVRELLGLDSSDFIIDEGNLEYQFICSGYGHGVGMSQYGAQGMAVVGYDYEEIVSYYYSGVEIVKIEA